MTRINRNKIVVMTVIVIIVILLTAILIPWNKLHSKSFLRKGIELAKQGKYEEAEPIYLIRIWT